LADIRADESLEFFARLGSLSVNRLHFFSYRCSWPSQRTRLNAGFNCRVLSLAGAVTS
jgi:hypothetical protein